MKIIGAAIKFYLVAVLFAYALAAITGFAVVQVTEPDQQERSSVYLSH